MKFGDVILCQKFYQKIIKYLMTPRLGRFHDVILYFRHCVGRECRKSELFCFYPICLKYGTRGNFEMLITKRKAKLTLTLNRPGADSAPPPPWFFLNNF